MRSHTRPAREKRRECEGRVKEREPRLAASTLTYAFSPDLHRTGQNRYFFFRINLITKFFAWLV